MLNSYKELQILLCSSIYSSLYAIRYFNLKGYWLPFLLALLMKHSFMVLLWDFVSGLALEACVGGVF